MTRKVERALKKAGHRVFTIAVPVKLVKLTHGPHAGEYACDDCADTSSYNWGADPSGLTLVLDCWHIRYWKEAIRRDSCAPKRISDGTSASSAGCVRREGSLTPPVFPPT